MSKARFLISTAALATVVAILTLAIGPRLQLGDDQMLVIQGGTLIDSTGRMPIENATIIIRGDKIVRIETKPKGDWPKDVRVIDAHGKFIIPGLWDTHVHFGGSAGGFILPEEFSPEQFALNCRAYLYNGVTSVLDIGGAKDIILEWRKMEREGSIKAPRIFAVGPIFTAPGGHPAGTIYKGNDWLIEQATRQVADPESARQEVRKLISEDRVDAIKAVYEGGDGSLPKLPLDVLRAIIDEAHRLGKRVFVHVGGPQEAIDALNAGADGIEHMIGADEPGYEEALQLAARKGAFWTPTLVVDEAFAHAGDERYIRDYSTAGSVSALVLKSLRHPQSAWQAFAGQERRQRHYKQVLVSLEAARKANVRISLGTDAGNPAVFHGLSVHRELELMVKAGYSPMEALIAATRAAAEKLGVERELGTLEPGKTADLIILSSNPLEDIRNTRKIELVIKGGVVYKREELAIKPGEPKIAQQEPPAQMPIQPKPSSQPISIEQARRSFVQARKLFYNAANAEEFLRAREQLQTLEAGLKALIGSTPNDAEAFYWLGQVQYALAESFEAGIKGVQADRRRARQYFEAAWDSAKRAVELDEKLSDAHRLIGDVIGRLIVYKGWQFAAANGLKAKAALERAIELDSKNAMAYLVLGHWYFFTPAMFGGDLKKALQAFAKALELADDEHEMFLAHIWLGQALMKQKELEKARDHFQRALAIYPNNRWAKALLDEMK